MKEKPIKKAFKCTPPKNWFDSESSEIFYAETRSKARYEAKIRWDIANPYWIGIKVIRSKENDLYEPKPVKILSDLTHEQKNIIAHSNGNSNANPGYRDYYNCSASDKDLLKLVGLGLMIGPQHVDSKMLPNGNGYFYLTKSGKEAAFSMLPRKIKAEL